MKIDLKFILLICLCSFVVATKSGISHTDQDNRINPRSNPDLISSKHNRRLRRLRNRTRHNSILSKKNFRSSTDFMYPYTDKGGKNNQGDYQTEIQETTPTIQKNLNFQLPFFGFRYNYIRVSLNGHLEFSDPQSTETYPLVYPVKNWPKENDPALIAIFHSKCRLGKLKKTDSDQRKPGVYFHVVTDLRRRRDRVRVEIRERLKRDIRQGNVGANNFEPKHAIIVTWKNISFAGGIDSARYKTNTFQIVLATDEVYTYVMFNYLNLDWTSHTEAGGDVMTGLGGIPAFVGFNAGNGTRSYEYQPFSQNSIIRNLITSGFGNGMKGRHYFRIDEQIYLENCDNTLMGFNLPLIFAPESGNMLGGTIVNITGPCFKPNDKITCKFGTNHDVIGVILDTNRAFCIQPPFEKEGYVNLDIAINDAYYYYKGKYYVENPATATQNIFFSDKSYNEIYPTDIKIRWNTKNLTLSSSGSIQISLWGYRESNNKFEFLYIADLGSDVINNGEFIIIPSNYKNRNNNDVLDVQFGFIQINTTVSLLFNEKQITPVIWSKPIPLAWYFAPQWEHKYGNWSEQFCNNWIIEEKNKSPFLNELPQCPCTLEQALADKGRFMPDFDCDKDWNPTCYFHRGAVHCVKSGLPSFQGAEQQCCYDKNHYLMLSQDQNWGSYPRRYHNSPSESSDIIPILSQWYHDIIPRYVCCMWQDENSNGCKTLRTELRPTQDCVDYKGPGVAGIYGDPHFITFDDLHYTFNGQGEFALVQSYVANNSLDVQGRFERMPENRYGEAKATQLTSIVARGNTSTVVEVRLRPKEARWRYHLDVFVDDRRVYFDQQSLKHKHFPGVTVFTPSYIFNQSQVIVMFDSGAGLEVMENNGQLSAIVYLPQLFINKTRGLFGNWSLDVIDDLSLADGTSIKIPGPTASECQRIHRDFGLAWMLSDSDTTFKTKSLFRREYGRLASYYNNKTFEPEFSKSLIDLIAENRSEEQHKALDLCKSADGVCVYDYAMTYDTTFAATTLYFLKKFEILQHITQTKVVSCGLLETPKFGRKSTFLFVPGTKVTFECIEGYILTGDSSRECLTNGTWNIPEYGYTKCSPKEIPWVMEVQNILFTTIEIIERNFKKHTK